MGRTIDIQSVPKRLVLIPFEVNIADLVIELQEELVKLQIQCDEIARSSY